MAEIDIDRALDAPLQALLEECFPGSPQRTYFKLPPHARYLAESDGALVGQMGVELRMIRVGDQVARTLGVVDLCVRPDCRSRGLAARLLDQVTELAQVAGVEFIVLFADDDRLYRREGWTGVQNTCSWLKINDHTTLGLAERQQTGALMVKAMGGHAWPEGDVDLLGHLF